MIQNLANDDGDDYDDYDASDDDSLLPTVRFISNTMINRVMIMMMIMLIADDNGDDDDDDNDDDNDDKQVDVVSWCYKWIGMNIW